MLSSVDRSKLEDLASESMCTDVAHSTGVLNLHGSRDSNQSDTVWELVGRDEWDEGAIASRDEVGKARRLGGYSGRWRCESVVSLSRQHGWSWWERKCGFECRMYSCTLVVR